MTKSILNSRYWRYQIWAHKHHISLQDWHEDNFSLLMRLMPHRLQPGPDYVTQPDNQPALQIVRTEQFKYTSQLEMRLLFEDEPSDAMLVRIYHDVHLAELWQAHTFDQVYQQMGGLANCRLKAQRRYSLNCFFNKWLRHLLSKGYAGSSWQVSGQPESRQPAPVK